MNIAICVWGYIYIYMYIIQTESRVFIEALYRSRKHGGEVCIINADKNRDPKGTKQ